MYLVRCFAADGRARDIRVRALSESSAIRAALRRLKSAEPGAGWRASWALVEF